MKKPSKTYVLGTLLLLVVFVLGLQAQNAEKIGDLYEKFTWRSIGPANMGGRVVDLAVIEKQPWIIYAAIGPSGVWKTENNGITWNPVFYKEKTVSVGDIAICQAQPNIIWVGTGEATARNSVTIGDGIYKSTDSGKTWSNMGLTNTRHISRVIIDPQEPNTVYVAAQGHLWGPNEERGVYKTLDGGETWEKVLYINTNTGIADLAIDPSDPQILYAAAWDYQRFPFYFYSGGPGSGLYKTSDGGKTWERLVKDLPEGVLGRIGVAVSRSNPNVVYALIEHKDGGIWRSEDKGKTWARTCDNKTYMLINFRPFYYSQIRVDPTDDKVVYVFSGGGYVSKDGGTKFRAISSGTHGDHHDLWIDPSNPQHLIDGNDGGIDITYDGGKNWYGIQHMALAEVYQIGYDMRNPYYVYCGLQDNGLWGGPSATRDVIGITNQEWYVVGGGDGFYCQVDPTDFNIVYGNSQMNGLYRYDHRLRLSKTIRPLASQKEPPYRFNWNSPILISPHDPNTVYTAGNFLFKSTDRGDSWEIISPDLSTNDTEKLQDSGGLITLDNTGAEVHCTIITVAESPVQPGVIWCGTDDGNVQLTRNNGQSWTNVAEKIPGLPANAWCSRIEASHFSAGTAYAAFDCHRSDDYDPYVYKTTDYGNTWTSITSNLPFGWVHVIREDLKNQNLLYVGTEFSVFASLDGGESWFSLKNNLPTVAVRDIAVHPRENDLILGTHGRGIWILDDISYLQNMSEGTLDSGTFFFPIQPATQHIMGSSQETFSKKIFQAQNPVYGANITAYFKEKPEAKPKLFIKDPDGNVLFEAFLTKKQGILRYTWNLTYTPRTSEGKPVRPGGVGFVSPPLVAPGNYEVELEVDENIMKQKLIVQPDARHQMSAADKTKQIQAQVDVIILSKKMGLAVTAVKQLRRNLDKLLDAYVDNTAVPATVQTALREFDNQFKPLEDEISPKGIGYRGSLEVALRGGSVSTQIMMLGMAVGNYPAPPTETDMTQKEELSGIIDELVLELNQMISEKIPLLNQILEEHELSVLRAPRRVEL